MSSILVSSQSFTRGPEIARLAAKTLGYRFMGEELYDEVARSRGFAVAELHKALDKPPSLFGISDATRRTLVAHLQAELAARLLEDEVVCHVPYAHALVPGVSHVLRVRFMAEVASRSAIVAKQEELSPRKADKRVAADDAARNSISQLLFGIEDDDERYDLVVDLDGRENGAAADSVISAIRSSAYAAMTYSTRRLQDLELGYRARSAIIDLDPGARVEAEQGVLEIRLWASAPRRAKLEAQIAERTRGLEGVRRVEVRVFEDTLRRARA